MAVFSVSAGAGHVRAAESLVAAASKLDIRATHHDVMDIVPPLFKKVYAESYLTLVTKHPALWGYLYSKTDLRKIDSALDKLRLAVERLNTQKLKDILADDPPDYIICTHFLPAQIFARWRRKKRMATPVWVCITDFDVHMLWVHHHLTGYCTASEEVAWRLKNKGIDEAAVVVTGIPVMPAFSSSPDREECARELEIRSNQMTILLMSGGAGVGAVHKLAERLLAVPHDFQLITIAGRNKRLLQSLGEVARKYPGRLKPLGFTTSIERVMAACDLVITKSGGLTTSECLAMGLPMIVVFPIPGQEERNADYLLEHGAAMKAYDEAGLEFRVRSLFEDPKLLETMQANARRLGRPTAATDVLNTVLSFNNFTDKT